MSKQLISNYFRLHCINQVRESISETANSVYYIFAAKHTSYPNGDGSIPDITNSVDQTFYSPYEEMIFGKRVGPSDVCVVTKRYNWTANTKYSAYRDNEDLTDKQFYVVVNSGSSYDVFKCLDNNSNGYSTVQPDVTATSPDDDYYSTQPDGYVWKYMYSVDNATFAKFATASFMPVVANGQVVGNASSGSIDTIVVDYRGSNYNTYLSNTFISTDLNVGGDATKFNIANNASPNNDFYKNSFLKIISGTGYNQNSPGKKIIDYVVVGSTKTVTLESAFDVSPSTDSVYEITPSVIITGDGEGATARALVNTSSSNSIYAIEILSRGSGYTWASAQVVGNTGGTSNAAVVSVVKGPKGGHGSNPEYELGSTGLCMSVSFANNETGTIPTHNDYRSIGVLKDPLFANVSITVTGASGAFTVNETITQANTGAVGKVTSWDNINTLTLTNVNGIILTGNSTVNYLTGSTSGTTASVSSYEINGQSKNFNTFDQRRRYSINPSSGSGTFTQDEVIYQTDLQLANAIFHSNTSSNVYITHLRGVLNTSENIIGVTSTAQRELLYAYPPDLVIGSGEVLYLENENVITRSNTQTETVKVILQF